MKHKKFPLIKLAKKLKVAFYVAWLTGNLFEFPLIKLAKKLKDDALKFRHWADILFVSIN